MINLKYISAITFFVGVAACLAASMIFYLSWNPTSSKIETTFGANMLRTFYIDKCELDDNKIIVNGWAFSPKSNRSVTSVYALTEKGRALKIEKKTVIRKDVTTAMEDHKNHDNSGFAAVRDVSMIKSPISKNFVINISDDKGGEYSAKFTCK